MADQINLTMHLMFLFRMKEQNLKPNDVTYGWLIDAWIWNKNIEKAEEVFRSMEEDKAIINTIIYTTMIKGYSNARRVEDALALLRKNEAIF